MTAALEGVSGQQHAPATLYPGKDPVPIVQEAGCAPGPVWMGRKSRPHRDSIPDRPARSQLLYQLSYPTHIMLMGTVQKSRVRMHFSRNQLVAIPVFGAGIFLDGFGSHCRYLHFINSTSKDTPYPTYLLTPWSRVLLEKLASLQLVKKFAAFYGTRRFLTALTSARHLSLC